MGVGLSWISLDSLVRIGTFQWVTRHEAQEIFLAPSLGRGRPLERSARGLADAEGGTDHGEKCNAPSAFPQEIVAAAIRLQPPQPKGDAR
jgi:hypothetical protein